MKATYRHTNLIAEDWRRLASFYATALGCTPVPPERDYRGAAIEAATGVPGAHLTGVHLRLPGWGDDGPTLEIFSYDEPAPAGQRAINRPGLAHLAFQVDDVAAARQHVLDHGGSAVGDVVTLTTKAGSRVTFCYVADPEGNGIELQCWASP